MSSVRRAEKFSMMPLCTSEIRPLQSLNGWALRSEGAPWVAQRVWAMPQVPGSGDFSAASASWDTRPLRLSRRMAPSGPTTAMPAES